MKLLNFFVMLANVFRLHAGVTVMAGILNNNDKNNNSNNNDTNINNNIDQ